MKYFCISSDISGLLGHPGKFLQMPSHSPYPPIIRGNHASR
jgi:hypothetical protein